MKNGWTERLEELQKENAELKEKKGGNQIEEGREEIIRNATNLIGSTNDLIKAVIDEDRKNIIFWRKSMRAWKAFLNKKVDRYLKKTVKEEVPF